MFISIQPLTTEDKTAIKRVFYIRLGFFFIFILPLLILVLYIVYDMLFSFINQDYDLLLFAVLIFITAMSYFFGPYFAHLYRDSFRNLQATEKKVVETRIINIEKRWTSKGKGWRYFIETEFNVIDSWKNVILMPGVIYPKLQTGDFIKIHFIDNNKPDILQIEK